MKVPRAKSVRVFASIEMGVLLHLQLLLLGRGFKVVSSSGLLLVGVGAVLSFHGVVVVSLQIA